MTSFLSFHAFAATRGEGLHPELRSLFERVLAAPHSELAVRNDGMVQSGPDPISAEVTMELGTVRGRVAQCNRVSATRKSGCRGPNDSVVQ